MPSSGESVVEFGPVDDAPRARRRAPMGGALTGLAGDHRLVPLAAALGGVALFGSLISEWQVTAVDGTFWGDGEVGDRSLVTTIADLDGWGGGYLTGLFLLVAAVVLTLFGPSAGRRYARLTALAAGGVLLAVVAAIASDLGDTSRIVGQLGRTNLENDQVTIDLGRGVWCAAIGAALVVLAMALAGRHLGVAAAPASPGPATDEEPPAAAAAPVWSWRRPATTEEDGPPDAPFDLTVTSAKPFTTSQANTDKPGQGISG
ncbi:hypothetical protein GCM10020358_72820 [Amorphoplanes nipponensis]|uniref:Tryptophan-associated transmembrane protein (Trp_oprn_chp) n=1 Tax=Actinoplanes nipponensis TaxID=135950 RepID=A0A919MU28_9ACTN|nr:hypothetical protein [Actinoplanes nipponensis]GIE49700.1 hypothetical protein Ani05nite_32340 [Actinoplanes nipponensis]